MAFGIRFQAQVFWIGPGAGPMTALTAPSLPGNGGGTGQIKEISTNPAVLPVVNGAGAGGTLSAGDITTLTNAVAADLVTQMTALASTWAGWPLGQP